MAPITKGVGYGMIVVRFMVNVYYCVICGWSVFYLIASWQKSPLPWGTCQESWNSLDCYSAAYDDACSETYYASECVTYDEYCKAHGFNIYVPETQSCNTTNGDKDATFEAVLEEYQISPEEDYFNGRVLGLYKNEEEWYTWGDFGPLQWEVVLCLGISWCIVCAILIKGLEVLGKAAYFITLSPYFVLTIFLIYALVDLDGASDGIIYFFTVRN